MDHMGLTKRPIGRIDRILAKIGNTWRYYPQLTLTMLVLEITRAANEAESDFDQIDMYDIEDIAYPEGNLFYGSRHLEMGIEAIEERHKDQPFSARSNPDRSAQQGSGLVAY
jgi:hypothetical protein